MEGYAEQILKHVERRGNEEDEESSICRLDPEVDEQLQGRPLSILSSST